MFVPTLEITATCQDGDCHVKYLYVRQHETVLNNSLQRKDWVEQKLPNRFLRDSLNKLEFFLVPSLKVVAATCKLDKTIYIAGRESVVSLDSKDHKFNSS